MYLHENQNNREIKEKLMWVWDKKLSLNEHSNIISRIKNS